MSERSELEASAHITAEACAWAAQMESGKLSPSDRAALREWVGRSPAHEKELREIVKLSGQMSILTEMAGPLAEVQAERAHPRYLTRRRFGLAAAGGAATIVAAGLFGFLLRGDPSALPQGYATAIGEYRTITLDDGSTIELNTNSRVSIAYSDRARDVQLLRGEAKFDVARDPNRPFAVRSANAVAEAVGTSFVVRLREGSAELTVIEGAVAFLRAQSLDAPPAAEALKPPTHDSAGASVSAVIVNAGQAAIMRRADADMGGDDPAEPELIAVSAREMQRRLSWTDGLLDFSETPLRDVVAEVSRHNPVRIEIMNPRLGEHRFGGLFRTGDVELLLNALEDLGVEVVRVGEGRYRLYESDTPKPD